MNSFLFFQPRTVTTNMNLRMQQSARELFTTVLAQTSEAQHCEYWATGFGERILFTCWGCLKYTPGATGGDYYISNRTSTILELEIVSSGLRYVLFSVNKIF